MSGSPPIFQQQLAASCFRSAGAGQYVHLQSSGCPALCGDPCAQLWLLLHPFICEIDCFYWLLRHLACSQRIDGASPALWVRGQTIQGWGMWVIHFQGHIVLLHFVHSAFQKALKKRRTFPLVLFYCDASFLLLALSDHICLWEISHLLLSWQPQFWGLQGAVLARMVDSMMPGSQNVSLESIL